MRQHDMTQLIYAIMSMNTFTVGTAERLLHEYYHGDGAYSMLIQEHLPRVMLGRQKDIHLRLLCSHV